MYNGTWVLWVVASFVVVVAGFSGSWWVVLQLGTDGVCWLLGQRAWVDGLPFVGLICMGIDRWFSDVGLAEMS